MDAEDLFGMLVPVTFLAMMALEAAVPARSFPARRGWRLIGLGCFLVMGAISTMAPMLLPQQWVAAHRLLDLSAVPLPLAVVAGYLAVSLASYAFHRVCHRAHFLWRLFHQMHHSPGRVDMAGAAFFHPLDMLAYALISPLVCVLVLGLSPLAAAATGFVAAFYAFFQHCNVRTPRWVGFIIQRPESHCRHHEYGVHAFNYSDLPLWDIAFGSFCNPESWEGRAGFGDEASRRVGAMLAFADVNPGQSDASMAGSGAKGAPAGTGART